MAIAFGLRRAHRTSPGGTAVVAAVVASLYGAFDEWHQLYVPGRSADWFDVLADAIGAIAAGFCIWIFLMRRAARRRSETEAVRS